MYQACIFDLDGTLADTLASIGGFANQALNVLGYPAIPIEEYRFLVGNGADVLMRGMLRRTAGNYTEEDVQRLRAVYNGLYEADPVRDVQNYPGMPELVAALRREQVPAAVLSNKPHNVVCAIVEALFPRESFRLCYGQRAGVARKPDPEGALLIAEELKAPPTHILYIGDTDVDMKTAAAAGMDSVGVLWGFRGREELERNHACFLAQHPADILEILHGRPALR
ncbi:HAD family hydrolase [Hydrogeniiclostridium mannosilyticum]|uniref:HAD family hydrolase n=1 Tax=Hydrogeniiclostridium mannosilyticum TaxID=2764322 RepID=UPI00399B1F2A